MEHKALVEKISILEQEHQDLDEMLQNTMNNSHISPFILQKIKKKKLTIKDQINKLKI